MIIKRMLSHLGDIVLRRDIEYSELQAGVGILIWSMWSLLFDNHQSKWDGVLGSLGAAVGCAQIYALLEGSAKRRRIFAMLACMVWFGLCVMFVFQERSLAAIQSALFSFGAGWGYLRLGRTARGEGNG